MAFPTSEELFNLSDEEFIKIFKSIIAEQKIEIDSLDYVKNVKNELIAQKTVIKSLQEMIFELLKRIENLLNNKEVQNRDNSVNIQMEEITEPRRLGFF
jgi:hypothetical protein